MKQIFKAGDKVFDIRYGWGLVVSVNMLTDYWPVEVLFDGKEELLEEYTFDGRAYINYEPILSFTEYTLEGFSQERLEELPKKGDIVWVRDVFPSEWIIGYFFKKEGDNYFSSPHPKPTGWTYSGIEIRTTNPYKNEQ
jgi:hypothetical protein